MKTNNKDRFRAKYKVKKGDHVLVIAGDDKGKTGKVLEVDSKTDRVLVEGRNIIKRHTKPNAQHTQGGVIQKEAYIHISNVALADRNNKAIKVGRKVENGKIVRINKKSGEVI